MLIVQPHCGAPFKIVKWGLNAADAHRLLMKLVISLSIYSRSHSSLFVFFELVMVLILHLERRGAVGGSLK